MDLKQLRALVAIAETGNVTKASALLNTVQPAVSRLLRLLEEDLGVDLFTRHRHGMELTDPGRALLEYARRIMNEVDRARAEIKPTRGSVGGIVTIGLLPSTSDLLSGAVIDAVTRAYPGIRLRFSVGHGGHLQQWLVAGEIDLALLYDQEPTASIQVKQLVVESQWVVGLPKLKLRPGKPVPLKWIATQPLILPSTSHGLRTLVEQAAASKNIILQVAVETNAPSVQKSLVLVGHGVTVLPAIAVYEDVARGILSAAPITNPVIERKIGLALSTSRQATHPVLCVVPLLVARMKTAVQNGKWPAARWVAE